MTMSVKMLAEIAAHAQAMADEAQAMATAMQAVVNDCAEQVAAKQGADAVNADNGANSTRDMSGAPNTDFDIELIWTKLQIAITGIGGWLGYVLGGMDGLLIALVVFMAIDYATGIMCAIVDKKLSSAVGAKGIFKKVLIMMLVGIAHVIDQHIVSTGSALRGATVCFYLSNEGLSILENTVHLGLPVPEKLKDVLAQLHHRGEMEMKDSSDDQKQ